MAHAPAPKYPPHPTALPSPHPPKMSRVGRTAMPPRESAKHRAVCAASLGLGPAPHSTSP
jgi:hypothetical protein